MTGAQRRISRGWRFLKMLRRIEPSSGEAFDRACLAAARVAMERLKWEERHNNLSVRDDPVAFVTVYHRLMGEAVQTRDAMLPVLDNPSQIKS